MLRVGIEEAAKIIKKGGVVAFPTETVFGLGGDAFNKEAVRSIYEIKGRPSDNPLILHVYSYECIKSLIHIPDYAKKLIETYWPGPLTIVGKKKRDIPEWVGGHPDNKTDTLGVRIPKNETALRLIQLSGCYIAAPSANKAGTPSPTKPEHVYDDFAVSILYDDTVIEIGIESTVIGVTEDAPIILRPGYITEKMINNMTNLICKKHIPREIPLSPGMKYRHYAPKAEMQILTGSNIADYIVGANSARPLIGLLSSKEVYDKVSSSIAFWRDLGDSADFAAKSLYENLRFFDKMNVDIIYATAIKEEGFGVAVMDRLLKAAGGKIIYV